MRSIDTAQVVLTLIGVFYALAGLVAIRASLQGRMLDVAISKISMAPPKRAETARGLWLLISSVVVLAGGLLLIVKIEYAATAFVISAIGQAVYLLVVAPWFLDPGDPPDEKGRQQTINAFILYSAATLFVLWAYRTDRLMPGYAVNQGFLWAAYAAIAVALVHGLWRFSYPMANGPLALLKGGRAAMEADGFGPVDDPDEADKPPLSQSRRILVMSEYECDPLWTHDPGRSGTISPRDLPLSESLVDDLEAWARSYDGSFNFEDLNNPNWSEAEYAAHDKAGLALARRLKRELPDRQIFVWRTGDGNFGHTEIRAEDL